jgi:hypothetical protein
MTLLDTRARLLVLICMAVEVVDAPTPDEPGRRCGASRLGQAHRRGSGAHG